MRGVKMAANKSKLKKRTDGWANTRSGKGSVADKSTGNFYHAPMKLGQQHLSTVYENDWLARKICEKPAKDAVRRGITFREKSHEIITDEMQRMNFMSKARDAISWGRLYGGAAMIFVVDDGKTSEEPLDYKAVRSIVDIMIIDRWYLSAEGINLDVLSVDYGTPSHYRVNGGALFHKSRVCAFKGAKPTYDKRMENQGWGGSFVQLYWDAISDFQGSMSDLRHLMADSSLGILSLPNLTNAKAMGGKAFDATMNRAAAFNTAKSIYRTAVIDAEESYTYVNRTLTGLSDVADRFMTCISGATELPQLILFGTTPGGLNASQEEQLDSYYDTVSSIQEEELTPAINMFLGCFTKGKQVTWVFNPLMQLSDTKLADVRNKEAQTAQIVADLVGMSPDGTAKFLNDTGHFQIDMEDGDELDKEDAL